MKKIILSAIAGFFLGAIAMSVSFGLIEVNNPSSESCTVLVLDVPAAGSSKPVYTKWGDVNEVTEKSDCYLITIKKEFQLEVRTDDPVSLVLPNGKNVDYGTLDLIDLSKDYFPGKVIFKSLADRVTHTVWTLKKMI